MKYSCCLGMAGLELAEQTGYDRMILPCTEIAACTETEYQAFCRRIADSPLQCRALNNFCPQSLRLCGPAYDPQAVAGYMAKLAPRAAALGVRYIGVGAPASRSLPPGYDRELAMREWLSTLRILCAQAQEYGMTILLEAVCSQEGNWMTTTRSALEVLERAGLPNLEIVFDTYHAYQMGEDVRPLRQALPHVRLVHVAQPKEGGRHYLSREDMTPYRPYLEVLLKAGYTGEIAVEAMCGQPEKELASTLSILKEICTEKE